jgi:SpoVK/Ycf46/Vps4 family AAA+-type ATPase
LSAPGSILLFDESDIIFGKRTQVCDSKDRRANLLTGFLLQRIKNFDGVSILTSNRKTDIDTAMLRRFDSIIDFRLPNLAERKEIRKDSCPTDFHSRGVKASGFSQNTS